MSIPPLTTYAKLCTEFYDREPHHNASQAETFYLAQAQRAYGRILEPMCGTGRFLIPMLQAGLPAEGFDASEYMLDALRQKCAALGIANPPAWQQFVQEFKNEKHYAMIFIPYGSWGLITNHDDARKGLISMYNHLAIGGKLFLEIETVNSVSYPLGVWRSSDHVREQESGIVACDAIKESGVFACDAINKSILRVHVLPSYNPTTQIFSASCRYESIKNGLVIETETEHFEQYLYHEDEMDKLLTQTGFKSINKYQGYDRSPVVDKNIATIIYECTKT